MEQLYTLAFWTTVFQIILIDLVLAGDNAMAVALACRPLPEEQRKIGIRWGVGIAIVLRIVLTMMAALLLNAPYVKLVGGILLLWIGVKLLRPKKEAHANLKPADTMWAAIRIIIIADVVMSLDNVLAVAGASKGNIWLLIFGLLLSIPIMLWMSQILLKYMARYPIIEFAGAGLLGWIAGGLIAREPVLFSWWGQSSSFGTFIFSLLGALLVWTLGWQDKFALRRQKV